MVCKRSDSLGPSSIGLGYRPRCHHLSDLVVRHAQDLAQDQLVVLAQEGCRKAGLLSYPRMRNWCPL